MSDIRDVLGFVRDLQIVATGDGFDISLTDDQIETLKRSLRRAAYTGDNKKSPVRVTNLRKVLIPVAAEIAWPYLFIFGSTCLLAGIFLERANK